MTSHDLDLIRLAADGELLFHTGTWGDPAGYRWCGSDGTEAGMVPPWEADALDALADRGLIAIERRRGPFDRRVQATSAGISALTGKQQAA